jgi:hypothetical protein
MAKPGANRAEYAAMAADLFEALPMESDPRHNKERDPFYWQRATPFTLDTLFFW